MSKDTGGPAFPCDDGVRWIGMTMRDYFAAAALTKLLAWDWTGPEGSMDRFPHYGEQAAKTAYAIADAMLAERAK